MAVSALSLLIANSRIRLVWMPSPAAVVQDMCISVCQCACGHPACGACIRNCCMPLPQGNNAALFSFTAIMPPLQVASLPATVPEPNIASIAVTHT